MQLGIDSLNLWTRGVAHIVLGFVPTGEIFSIGDQRVDDTNSGPPAPHSNLHFTQHHRSCRPVSSYNIFPSCLIRLQNLMRQLPELAGLNLTQLNTASPNS